MKRATDSSDTQLEHDAALLHRAVSELVRVYQFRDRDRICCHDISVTQCYALETLLRRGPLRLGELAAELVLDKSTTSRVVAALTRKRYVERTTDPRDKRTVVVAVTAAGRALHRRITKDLIEQQKGLLRDLDPELRSDVAKVIEQLAAAADARFRTGVSVGPAACAAGSCGTAGGAC
ncbi:MAG: MarR family transcriptional regulator [Acidobacteriota bacterium]